jgi:biopolymer transport protein ExbD
MRFDTRKRRTPSIVIVSLIDILAILLIFFIVSTTFRKKQPQVQINLPDSKEAETSPAPSTEPVVLRVKNSDQISLDDKPVALDQLAAAIQSAREAQPQRGIALQADREAPFGVVV